MVFIFPCRVLHPRCHRLPSVFLTIEVDLRLGLSCGSDLPLDI
jgi:hypothetical protein